MPFMERVIIQKGNLYTCDCQHCGASNYWHEWISDGASDVFHESVCSECGKQIADSPDAVRFIGRQYAGRYSAPGYMDCTDWLYSKNHSELLKELRDLYGDSL